MSSPKVSVVVITWNRREDVLETVRSVFEQPYQNLEVIVVDNGSTDGTAEALREAYPGVRVIALETNTGVSAGRNAGIVVAQGEIIFCLDSDANPGHDTLVNLVRRFEQDPDLGVINSKVVNAYTKKLGDCPGWVYSKKQMAKQDMEFLSWSLSETGAAIRKEVFDRAGVFWDKLFFLREGEELSLRVWDAGYKVLYYPKAVVYHRVSPRQRVAGVEYMYRDVMSSFFVCIARYPWWMLSFYLPLKLAAFLVQGIRRRRLKTVLQALLDVVRQLPALWRQRRPIRGDTARFYLRLQREQGPLSWDPISWLKYKA